jgi:hypothetical protein
VALLAKNKNKGNITIAHPLGDQMALLVKIKIKTHFV